MVELFHQLRDFCVVGNEKLTYVPDLQVFVGTIILIETLALDVLGIELTLLEGWRDRNSRLILRKVRNLALVEKLSCSRQHLGGLVVET